ncbi:MAG TPA: ABC transporter substrate-binding protein [Candidatus Binatia bacterium]|nr:ABC transporter substrate-binding protein [Candidatus Binatia bacterium]
MARRLALFVAAILVGASAGACKNNPTDEIVVGEFASLTGGTATFGRSSDAGVQLAVEEINAAGGLLGKKVRVVVEDDQSKPEEARTAVLKLLKQDEVVAVLGEVASSRSLAAAPECQRAAVPMISPASTNPRVTAVGDYIFRVCFIDPFQGSTMAKFAIETLHATTAAILRDVKNDYSVGLADFFRDEFARRGGKILIDVSYSEGDIDFKAQLTAIRGVRPEVVFVPGYYTEVGLIARHARELGITVPLLGGDGWDSPRTVEIGGAAVNGCYFSNHYAADDPNPIAQRFIDKFRKKYSEVPDAMAVLGYDAMGVLADAIHRAGTTDGKPLRDAIASTKDYPGVSGKITIDEKRNARKSIVVLKIDDGKVKFFQKVEP